MVDENKVLLKEIEKYAKENKVPIMQKDGIKFLTNYVQEQGVKSILEVGTAIGYSAICMALVDPKIKITKLSIGNSVILSFQYPSYFLFQKYFSTNCKNFIIYLLSLQVLFCIFLQFEVLGLH